MQPEITAVMIEKKSFVNDHNESHKINFFFIDTKGWCNSNVMVLKTLWCSMLSTFHIASSVSWFDVFLANILTGTRSYKQFQLTSTQCVIQDVFPGLLLAFFVEKR